MACVFAAAFAAPATAHACAGAGATISQAPRSELVGVTLCLLNQERAQQGLPALRLDRRLSRAAQRHSTAMVRRRYFAHGPFLRRIKRSGYLRGARSWSVGENIAWGTGDHGSPSLIVRAWMNSPGHRRNILGRFRHVGIGIKAGAPRGGLSDSATYTTDFGRR
jgi:uncharacterized protein YkwD